MDTKEKEHYIKNARNHLENVRHRIKDLQNTLEKDLAKKISERQEVKTLSYSDQIVYMRLIRHVQERFKDITELYPSPYFVRCLVEFDDEKKKQTLFFAKFSFTEETIYSWITKAAVIRFENPGKFSYELPNGKLRHGTLLEKDQYLIVDGKILFFSKESVEHPRKLIYQEHFSTRKTEFVLPEIVEQMEKAQDQVIRAHHAGPFLISGPAGSGKTTLALHRVAYLAQSPDTAHLYKTTSMIVFVQDAGTKEYFSHLLPELGIRDVTIATFFDWATQLLSYNSYTYTSRFGRTEEEKDRYEYAKITALHAHTHAVRETHPYGLLEKIYKEYFTEKERATFEAQKKQKALDRFDLTLLLINHKKNHGSFTVEREEYIELKNGRFKREVVNAPIEYSLIVVDEFQNYLGEQIQLLTECANQTHKSIMYIGDMAQQVQLGTIKDFKEISEHIDPARKVTLKKVYRNTRNILEYIRTLGYPITLLSNLKIGAPVTEKIVENKKAEIEYVQALASRMESVSIGIIAKNAEYLDDFKHVLEKNKNIKVMSMIEAQGVEFDTLFIVGIDQSIITPHEHLTYLSDDMRKEKQRIDRDLLYVALTRAANELHIVGNKSLKSLCSIDK